jgi:hypothetical protein
MSHDKELLMSVILITFVLIAGYIDLLCGIFTALVMLVTWALLPPAYRGKESESDEQ